MCSYQLLYRNFLVFEIILVMLLAIASYYVVYRDFFVFKIIFILILL